MEVVPKGRSEIIKKQRVALLSLSLAKLATIFGVTLTRERLALYLEPLSDLTERQIVEMYQTTSREWKPFKTTFPSPAELREFALKYHDMDGGVDPATLPDVGDKPPDWRPCSIADLQAELKRRKESSECE